MYSDPQSDSELESKVTNESGDTEDGDSDTENEVISINLNDHSPLDVFKLFFDQKLVQLIVDETNNFQAKWSCTNPEEIYLYLATFMLMAHVKKDKTKDYWSTNCLIATPIFGDTIPRDRFLLLLTFLHFNNNKEQSETDKLFKIRSVVQHLKKSSDVL